jgi:hypothetical protein
MLLSNVMPDQPPGANTMSATIPDVGSSEQDGINSVTGQAGSLNPSASSNNVGLVRNTGKIPKLYILARTVPLCTKNGQDLSFRPLQHDIWCLVLDTSTKKSKFMLLCECQDLARSGVDIEDVDRGKGIHPVADKAWMQHLIHKGKSSLEVYKPKDVVSRPVGKISHSTVFLHVENTEHMNVLDGLRSKLGYTSDEPVRVPRSMIKRGEVEKQISELITANSEDPAPCKHLDLSVGYKRKASKLNSKNAGKRG